MVKSLQASEPPQIAEKAVQSPGEDAVFERERIRRQLIAQAGDHDKVAEVLGITVGDLEARLHEIT